MSSSETSPGRQTLRKPAEKSAGEAASRPSERRPARAELVWEGKYDAEGRRVAPLRVALPFQTVETVNESAQDRQRGFLFGAGFRRGGMAQPADLGRQEIRAAVAAGRIRGQGEPHLHRPAVRHRRGFLLHRHGAGDPDSEEDDSFTFTKEPSIIEHKGVSRHLGARAGLVPAMVLRNGYAAS